MALAQAPVPLTPADILSIKVKYYLVSLGFPTAYHRLTRMTVWWKSLTPLSCSVCVRRATR